MKTKGVSGVRPITSEPRHIPTVGSSQKSALASLLVGVGLSTAQFIHSFQLTGVNNVNIGAL